jgi:hypothetical protein
MAFRHIFPILFFYNKDDKMQREGNKNILGRGRNDEAAWEST